MYITKRSEELFPSELYRNLYNKSIIVNNTEQLVKVFMEWNLGVKVITPRVEFLLARSRHLLQSGGEGLLIKIFVSQSLLGSRRIRRRETRDLTQN